MEKTKVYQIESKTIEAPSCNFCEDGIAEFSCYACGRKLCFFCIRRVKDKLLCFFHFKLFEAFKGAIEQYKMEEKGGEKV